MLIVRENRCLDKRGVPVVTFSRSFSNTLEKYRQAYASPGNPQQPCREAEILAVIDGKTQKTHTTACRNSRGQWELKNQ